jgi:hypothetical protein
VYHVEREELAAVLEDDPVFQALWGPAVVQSNVRFRTCMHGSVKSCQCLSRKVVRAGINDDNGNAAELRLSAKSL